MKKSLAPDAVRNLSLAVALIFFTGTLAVALLPKPDSANVGTYRRQVESNRKKERSAKKEADLLQAQNAAYLWALSPEQIESRSLDSISRISRATGVKLVAFRPQRAIEGPQVQHLPFLAIVEGKYPAIVRLIRTLEQPSFKLALNSVQISATDGASDSVSASVVLIAYRDPKLKVQVNGKGK